MKITPDTVHELLAGAKPGPWEAAADEDVDDTRLFAPDGSEIDDGDSWELARRAPEMAEFIDGMTELWLFQVKDTCSGDWETRGSSTAAPEDQHVPSIASRWYSGRETRWVRQYVTTPEVVDGE